MESLKEIAHFELSSCLGSLKGPGRVLTSLFISEELFIVGGWDFLCVYNFSTGAIKQLNIKTLRRIGAIYGLVFSEDGRSLYITSSRGFFIMDPYNFSVLYEYINHSMETGFDFQWFKGLVIRRVGCYKVSPLAFASYIRLRQ